MKEPLKIALATPIYLPLLDRFLDCERLPCEGMGGFSVSYLADALLELGQHVTVHTLDPTLDAPVKLVGQRLTVFVGPFRRKGRMRDLMRAERHALQRSIAIDRPDVVHAHWTYEYAHAAIASRLPHVITVRDWSPGILRYHKDAYRFGRFLMDRQTLRSGSRFTVNSPYLQRKVERATGKSVPITPNAIPDRWFRETRRERSGESFHVVSINNGFFGRKNGSVLVEAFARFRQRQPRASMTLVGDGYGPGQEAARWAGERGIEEGVTFLGKCSNNQIKNLLDEADLLAHPALEESFGMTLVEAMARRVPVIGGRTSGAVPWVLDEGTAGLLVDVTDPRVFADAMGRLAQDDELWKLYSEKGYQSARHRFHAEEVARGLINIYETTKKEP